MYQMLDHAVTHKFLDRELAETCQALKQSLAVLPHAARRSDSASLIETARRAAPDNSEPFEKDGETIVGHLAFTFDASGALTRVTPTWDPFECRD